MMAFEKHEEGVIIVVTQVVGQQTLMNQKAKGVYHP